MVTKQELKDLLLELEREGSLSIEIDVGRGIYMEDAHFAVKLKLDGQTIAGDHIRLSSLRS